MKSVPLPISRDLFDMEFDFDVDSEAAIADFGEAAEELNRILSRATELDRKKLARLINNLLRQSGDLRPLLALLPYRRYLQTQHWKISANAVKARSLSRCQMCGVESKHLEAHHNSYERLGCELESDLISLCRQCHKRHHNTCLNG